MSPMWLTSKMPTPVRNALTVLESNVRRGARTTHPTRARLPPPTCYLKPENARQTPELMVTKGTFGRQGTALQFANDHENQGAVRAMRAERAEMRMREVLLFLSVAT